MVEDHQLLEVAEVVGEEVQGDAPQRLEGQVVLGEAAQAVRELEEAGESHCEAQKASWTDAPQGEPLLVPHRPAQRAPQQVAGVLAPETVLPRARRVAPLVQPEDSPQWAIASALLERPGLVQTCWQRLMGWPGPSEQVAPP